MRFSCHPAAAILFGGLAITITGCSQNAAAERSAASKSASKPVVVKAVAVTEQDVRHSTVQPATVHPFYTAAIQAKVHGYVEQVAAEIGDVVASGDTLAVINVPEMAVQRLKAVAQLEQQKAEAERAAAGIEVAKANVASAEALATEAESRLQQIEAALAAAESEFRRTDDLVGRGSMQPRVLDEVRERRDSVAASKAAVAAAIQSAIASVNVAKAELTAAIADSKAAAAHIRIQEAEVAHVDELINYATLKAPFAGIVTARSVSPGDLVSERSVSEPLFVVSQVNKVRVQIPVPEKAAALVAQGDLVSLRFPSFPGEEAMSVSVTRLTGTLDPSTRMMLVEAEVDNTDGKLIPGMFGSATIELPTQVAANVLPARSVRFDESGKAYVYLLAGNEVSVVPVTTGSDDGNTIEIIAGVSSGQKVIDAHIKRFSEGEEVTLLP